MNAVLYDPATGRIAQSIAGTQVVVEATAEACGKTWLALDPDAATLADIALTHRVRDGELVEMGADA